ncbi:MAG: hypothetical protein AMXMBFR84_35660 [Candidatus Hydrogenedentota bacterium]
MNEWLAWFWGDERPAGDSGERPGNPSAGLLPHSLMCIRAGAPVRLKFATEILHVSPLMGEAT